MPQQKEYFMTSNKINCLLVLVGFLVASARPAAGQAPVGSRAAGMAGAFVGVADDATATFWNPAGLATGDYVSGVLDLGGWRSGARAGGPGRPGGRETGAIVAFSVPPLGLSYYQLWQYGSAPLEAAVSGVAGREDGRRRIQAVATATVGVTLLQSIGEHFVIGTTLKAIRGATAQGVSTSPRLDDALDAASELERAGHTTGDIDLGAMVTVDRMRLGIVARNLSTPSFAAAGGGAGVVELGRQVRIGAGWGSSWPGMSRVIVALDGDLTSRPTPAGDRREVAAGVETWWRGQRLGVRGGLRASTRGAARAAAAVGVSMRLTGLLFLDGQAAAGQADERSWSLGARLAF